MNHSISGLQMKLMLLKNAIPIAQQELEDANMDTFLQNSAESLLFPAIVVDAFVDQITSIDPTAANILKIESFQEAASTVHASLTTAYGSLVEIQTSMNGRKAEAEKKLNEACTHLGLLMVANYLENVASEIEVH